MEDGELIAFGQGSAGRLGTGLGFSGKKTETGFGVLGLGRVLFGGSLKSCIWSRV